MYTRSNKRGNIQRIIDLFVQFGADENILFEAHPHIGTNKLPAIISSMRRYIIECGGEIHFNRKLCDATGQSPVIKSLKSKRRTENSSMQRSHTGNGSFSQGYFSIAS
ncbi:MAG: hypothetical protein WDM78_22790 [Puia sp.]